MDKKELIALVKLILKEEIITKRNHEKEVEYKKKLKHIEECDKTKKNFKPDIKKLERVLLYELDEYIICKYKQGYRYNEDNFIFENFDRNIIPKINDIIKQEIQRMVDNPKTVIFEDTEKDTTDVKKCRSKINKLFDIDEEDNESECIRY